MVFREWDPWEEMDRMQRRMYKMMRRVWSPFRRTLPEVRDMWRYDSFPVNLSDRENELVLTADLPGFERDEINVRVLDDRVDIVANKKREKKEVTENMYRQERSMGSMRRMLTLPTPVDPEAIKAELKDGVLTLRMKKKKVKEGKEIKIS